MRIIAINRDDGGCSVMRILDDGADIDMLIKKYEVATVITAVSWAQITEADIPADRTFRNAWTTQAGKILHDIPKCKSIAHDGRRIARAKELAPLDIEATIPGKTAQAEAARQVIRDKYAAIQISIDSATDVSTLKNIIGALA